MNPRCDRSTVLIKEFSAHRTNRTTTTIEPAPVVRDLQAQTHPCDSYMQRDFSPHWKLIHSLNLLYIFIVHTMVAWEYKPQPLTVNVFGIRGVNIRIFAHTHIHNEHSLEPACFNPFPIHLRRHSAFVFCERSTTCMMIFCSYTCLRRQRAKTHIYWRHTAIQTAKDRNQIRKTNF